VQKAAWEKKLPGSYHENAHDACGHGHTEGKCTLIFILNFLVISPGSLAKNLAKIPGKYRCFNF
jgi:hypothetical protein